MEKIKTIEGNRATPDEVYVPEWRVYADFHDDDAIPMIYDNGFTLFGLEPLLIGEPGTTHGDVEECIQYVVRQEFKDVDKDDIFHPQHSEPVYLRVYANANMILTWGDDQDFDTLGKVVNCLKTGNYDCVKNIPKNIYTTENDEWEKIYLTNELPLPIDADNLEFYWEGYEEEPYDEDGNSDDVRYVYRAPVSELTNSGIKINKADDSEQRLFHLMTPEEKAEYLKNNDEKYQERVNYFKQGEKAWDAKHPGWDPAQYHLAFYQENKTMKIGEKEIRQMVSETVRRVLKEAYDDTANITLSEFTYCTEKLNRLVYKLQEANNELLSCAKEIIEGMPRYGLAIENVSNELNEYGLTIKGNITITNPDDVDPEDYNLNDSFDYKEYIRNTLDELFYDIKSWKKPKYVEDITFVDNSILIEMDEFNPIRISKNLPDV